VRLARGDDNGMKQRLLNVLTALSLVLCLGVCVLWVRSHFAHDKFTRRMLHESPALFRLEDDALYTSRGVLSASLIRRELILSPKPSEAETVYERESVYRAVKQFAAEAPPGWNWGTDRPGRVFPASTDRPLSHFGFLGWAINEHDPGVRSLGVGWSTPFWFLALLTAAIPTVRLVTRLRQRRPFEQGHCPACGYDMTGNVTGVCPECGMPAAVTTR
jgi:hypothetical protein